MRNLIINKLENCVGCNRCVRYCPIEEANKVYIDENEQILVEVDSNKCVACGICVTTCHHGSRDFADDTERFFSDLKKGVDISLFAAPAAKVNFDNFGRVIQWLRNKGVKQIYDVSLGADICTWGHIRYFQRSGLRPIISQPCPSIVNYILMYKPELVKHLSPIHSPMLCTAIYMRKYQGVTGKIAALSPCIAKAHEFEATQGVEYNVTLANLIKYIDDNNITLPPESSGFDHYDSGLGTLYPMPGGLKENLEHYLGKTIRVDKSEGTSIVYKALDEYALKQESKLPTVFDVLNCAEGCNQGTACKHDKDSFDMNTDMNDLRQAMIAEDKVKYLDELFERFDDEIRLDDFIRTYRTVTVRTLPASSDAIDRAFRRLGKLSDEDRVFDCGACGCDSCHEMASMIAKGISVPENCIDKMHKDIKKEHIIAKNNLSRFDSILADTEEIKTMSEQIVSGVETITEAMDSFARMVADVEKIALQINIIAINASIEAARAGQHGRSFGVVAEEIRRLAQTSNTSAQQTKEVSSRAAVAIEEINGMVANINTSVNMSYENMNTVAEDTKRMLSDNSDNIEDEF